MAIRYPTSIVDGTGRTWTWSELWGGYRAPGETTHGYETIKRLYGIQEESR